MNQSDRQLVALKIFETAAYYGHKITAEEVTMYLNILVKQFGSDPQPLISALAQYENNKAHRQFPAPVHLRQYIEPEVQTEDVSASLVADIATSIRSHGYEWPNGYIHHAVERYWRTRKNSLHATWEDAVKSELGDIGVEVIRRYTWRGLCDLYYSGNIVAFNSQIKNYITATQNILKSGNVKNLYALQEPTNKHVLDGETRNGITVYKMPPEEGS